MDDKTGTVCNQGPYPVLNTLKNELQKPEPVSSTEKNLVTFPRGFWSKKRHDFSSAISILKSSSNNQIFILILKLFIFINYILNY